MPDYGSGGGFTVTMDGPFGTGGGGSTKLVTISTSADNWKGAASPYSQEVNVEGITVNSVVYITLSADQIQNLIQAGKEVAFTAENNGGVVTIKAVGDHPGMDCTFQASLVEVVAL